MNYEREFERISETIGLIRNITILLIVCFLCTVGAFIFIPGAIPHSAEIYLGATLGFFIIFCVLALILARKDVKATLFFTALGQFLAGTFFGIAIISVQKII